MPGSALTMDDEDMNDSEISSSRGGIQFLGEISQRTIFKGTLKSGKKFSEI
jgi:hypothetical protein